MESFILLPIVTISSSVSSIGNLPVGGPGIVSTSQAVFSQKFNIESIGDLAFSQALDSKDEEETQAQDERKAKAEAIDTYFRVRGMPLAGTGMKMVLEAEAHDLDWRLIPAIAVRESTGGKHECKRVENNPFGWGSCKIGFESNEKAIETIARNLGGNNPNTHKHYADKDTKQILRAYNPPSVVPHYAEQVMRIMDAIDPTDLGVTTEKATT